jgi:CRP/FNR family transcriptional regulator, nitrogen fixation regulation protein
MSGHTQMPALQLQAIHSAAQPSPKTLPPMLAALNLLEDLGTPIMVRREQEIYAQDDQAEFYYEVISGSVRTVRLMADGRRQVSEFLMPGDVFGFDALDTYDFAAEALEDTLLRRLPRRRVEALAAQHAGLSQQLRRMMNEKLRQAHERMMVLGRMTASERIASFLLHVAERSAGRTGGQFDLTMSRRDIADYLGLTIETVSRTLTMLKGDGTIAMLKKCRIEIRNRAALESMASEPRH